MAHAAGQSGRGNDDAFTMGARTISGCGVQTVELLVFLPLLMLAIVLGIGWLIVNFWMANWKPSLLQGCFAIFGLACVPMVTLIAWQRWRFRRSAADVILTITPDALEISRASTVLPPMRLEWNGLQHIASRRLKSGHFAVRIVGRGEVAHLDRMSPEYALCADPNRAQLFIAELVDRVPKRASQRS